MRLNLNSWSSTGIFDLSLGDMGGDIFEPKVAIIHIFCQ